MNILELLQILTLTKPFQVLCVKASVLTASPVTCTDSSILFATCVYNYLVKRCGKGVADLHLHGFNTVQDYLVIMLS